MMKRISQVSLLALLLSFGATDVFARGGGRGGPPAAPVIVAKVESRSARELRTFTGTLEPRKRGRIDTEIAGLVETFPFDLGDPVREGQTVAILRDVLVKHRLTAAKAQRDALKALLGELEAGSRKEDIDRAKARVTEAQARVEKGEWTLARTRTLFEGGRLVSAEALQEAESTASQRRAELAALRAELALLEAGSRREVIAAAKARVAAQDAAILLLEEEERQHIVKAPFAGIVVAEHAEKGQWLSEGGGIVELVAIDAVEAVIPVSEDHIGALREGTKVSVAVPAVRAEPFAGTIRRILPLASERTRSFPVRIRIPNPEQEGRRLLLPGMTVTLGLAVGPERLGTFVPKDALRLGGTSPEVAVVDPRTKGVAIVPVQLGTYVGSLVQVRGNVPPDGLVIIEGNERIFPGMTVSYDEPK